MNKRIWKSITAGLAYCLTVLFCGCDNSLPTEEENGKFIIQLKMPPALEVQTKAGTLNGIQISDVWVLQYKPDGTLFVKKQFTNIGTAETNQTIVVETSGFSNIESNFYVIANAGNNMTEQFNGSAEELKKLTKGITLGTTAEPTLLSAGPIAYTPKTEEGTTEETPAETTNPTTPTDPNVPGTESTNGKAIIVAPLQRAFARINMIWNQSLESTAKGTVAITKVEVSNLPENMTFYLRGGGDLNTPFPTTLPSNNNVISNNLDAGSKLTFHMAENLRGMGTGTTFAEKNKSDKGPINSSGIASLDGCTYVLLSGTYTYKTGTNTSATNSIGVQYKIYLGGNLKNDYNIQRGNSYTLTVNINGANSADLRVSITDGNVAIFDDVDTITNEITFE
ncbi:DUF4906 domain-containing protein [Parabacteroides sp.]